MNSMLVKELYEIRANPLEYMEGEADLERLVSYIIGFSAAEAVYNINDDIVGEEFSDFVKKRHNIALETIQWITALRWITADDKSAFKRFYYELDSFINENNKEIFSMEDSGAVSYAKQEKGVKPELLCSHIEKMRKRPGMWLGTKDVERMYFFIKGFIKAELIIHGTAKEHPFEGLTHSFTNFVRQVYNIKENVSWLKILEFKSENKEEALEKFYCLFDDYRKTFD